jgi:hypothetical protein
MNYFLSSLARSKFLWGAVVLSAVAGLNVIDIMLSIFAVSPFRLWAVKATVGVASAGAIAYGFFLRKRDRRDSQLRQLLPRFQEERRALLMRAAGEDPAFQTFCHECRHFDQARLACLLDLRGRKVRVRLSDESCISHCLYWNLEDAHPVMGLTRRLKEKKADRWEPV